MSTLAHIETVFVPLKVAAETQRFLQTVGRQAQEGLVLWVGTPVDKQFHVMHPFIPRQRGIRTPDGVCAVVDSDEMHRINVELFKSRLRLIAQIHSHPTDAYHSETDDEHAIANTVGCLSLVVPDFGAGDFNLANTAVYRLAQSGEWKELHRKAAATLIQLV
jgi:hypothetical protein